MSDHVVKRRPLHVNIDNLIQRFGKYGNGSMTGSMIPGCSFRVLVNSLNGSVMLIDVGEKKGSTILHFEGSKDGRVSLIFSIRPVSEMLGCLNFIREADSALADYLQFKLEQHKTEGVFSINVSGDIVFSTDATKESLLVSTRRS